MPDAGVDSSMRAGPSSRKRQPDPTEVRLADAEKEVAIALETFAYDEVIGVATEALNLKHGQAHVDPSKATIKSRKTLLWARSHAYYHQDRYEQALKDAKAALKLDPHDVAAYIRAAVLLGSTGHKVQALSCLDIAESLSHKCESGTKALWLRRIDKQRRKMSGASWRVTDRLPSEIMVEIASHLDGVGRCSMSQTCRSWRHMLVSAPRLWTSLSIKTTAKVLSARKSKDLLQYILMRAKRAGHSLETVVLQNNFGPVFLEMVVEILRASMNSLMELHIPAPDQRRLYERLYRHCPQLKLLSYPEATQTDMPDFEEDQDIAIPVVMDGNGAGLSQLESFDNAIRGYPSELHGHFHKLRILKNYNPFSVHPENGVFKFDDEQMASSILENLEDWGFFPFRQIQRPGYRPCPAEFAKLTRLTEFVVEARCLLEFTFPSLLELQIQLQYGGPDAARELIRILRTSPKLRNLTLGYCPRFDPNQYADVCQALSRLQDLRKLDLSTDENLLIAELLLPHAVYSASGKLEVMIPLPQLDTIILDGRCADIDMLAISLLVREHLRTGHTLTAARKMASDRILPLPKRQTTFSPFQRGSTSATDTARASFETIEGPCLDDASKCRRLQRVELIKVIQVQGHIKSALEFVCDEVKVEYTQL
ncbi:hypothetical protein PHSY_002120 [Pseudozyma hubeiensis SY62]|uniref:F-box domain-containing protein n=1 Tax=Pseudozyma hubeiensis (strain SY62) TaxID=1305764 RepID=R9P036_PSEHS|nr:hypothetical protein PHSY_002120 [Pseudozyma hubeiensis SY62]GAC94548.1 hypothetical protein PHSY_002120 [Pseudozyma hubeiensis SY62]